MHSVRILWGLNPEEDDEIITYRFDTKEKLDAFREGVEAAVGWLEHRELEEGESYCISCNNTYTSDTCLGCSDENDEGDDDGAG